MADDPKKLTAVVGRILSDPIFRRSFKFDPEGTLADADLDLEKKTIRKIEDIRIRLEDTGMVKTPGGENALHVNIASSVGVA